MSYTISKRGSKSIVKFACPTCAAPLESPLEEAGKHFPCPNCGKPSAMPGVEELKKHRAAQAEAEAREIETMERHRQEADRQRLDYERHPNVEISNTGDVLGELAAATASTSPTHFVEVPDYGRIIAGAFVLRLLSYVAYAGAAIIALILVIHLIGVAQSQARQPAFPVDSFVEWLVIAGHLAGITGYAMVGALLGLLSSLSLAVRDMARNSFRR